MDIKEIFEDKIKIEANVTDRNENELKKAIQNLFAAPEELIQINSNIVLNKIAFIKSITEENKQ